MPRALVTGGAGFIGSFVCERLLAAGFDVRVLDNLDPQVHQGGQLPAVLSQVDFLEGDVRDPSMCAAALDGADVVIHAASAVGIGQSLYRVRHFIDVNTTGTATLLEALAARRQPVKLVTLTSMTGYGEGVYRRPSDGRQLRVDPRADDDIDRFGWEPVAPDSGEPLVPHPTPEDAALLCRNVYALSKRHQEELSLALGATYGFPVTCLRLFSVYGPRQSLSNPYTGVIAIFLSRLLAGESPLVYEDGLQTRDFVSVHDVVDAVLAAVRSSGADGQVVNIGSGVGQPIKEVALALARAVGREDLAPVISHRYRSGDIRHCTADLTRARTLLGFAPGVAWEQGLAEVVEWARSAPSADRVLQADHELEARGLVSDRRRPVAQGPAA
jgi:dTDP-L-rhamnose 4-epimerase